MGTGILSFTHEYPQNVLKSILRVGHTLIMDIYQVCPQGGKLYEETFKAN